jgi:hypothetical protein
VGGTIGWGPSGPSITAKAKATATAISSNFDVAVSSGTIKGGVGVGVQIGIEGSVDVGGTGTKVSFDVDKGPFVKLKGKWDVK